MELVIYAVRNKEGKFFRSKGYGGSGVNWVDNISQARLYSKIGPARAIISFYANAYPSYGIPDLIKLTMSKIEVVDESTRVKKVTDQKKRNREEAEVRQKEMQLDRAMAEYNAAQNKLKKLRENL